MSSLPRIEQICGLVEKVVDWYWRFGCQRKGEHLLSPGRWLDQLYCINLKKARIPHGSASFRANPNIFNESWGKIALNRLPPCFRHTEIETPHAAKSGLFHVFRPRPPHPMSRLGANTELLGQTECSNRSGGSLEFFLSRIVFGKLDRVAFFRSH